ncbi:MAG: hypothetical protein J5U17_12195 [Candidatus Methanoperedens sp.]|nr:hypothetical protein [Candidatus Methanoperedens sp.]
MGFFYWCERQGDCEPDPKISGKACACCMIAMNVEFIQVMRDLETSREPEENVWYE